MVILTQLAALWSDVFLPSMVNNILNTMTSGFAITFFAWGIAFPRKTRQGVGF